MKFAVKGGDLWEVSKRVQQMLYDVIMSDASIVISRENSEAARPDEQMLMIRVMAENNSYLPLGDRYVLLYAAGDGQLEDTSQWIRVRTDSGNFVNELEYAYPMQRVWTKEAFHLSVKKGMPLYLIAQINDAGGELSFLPDSGVKGITDPEQFQVLAC